MKSEEKPAGYFWLECRLVKYGMDYRNALLKLECLLYSCPALPHMYIHHLTQKLGIQSLHWWGEKTKRGMPTNLLGLWINNGLWIREFHWKFHVFWCTRGQRVLFSLMNMTGRAPSSVLFYGHHFLLQLPSLRRGGVRGRRRKFHGNFHKESVTCVQNDGYFGVLATCLRLHLIVTPT